MVHLEAQVLQELKCYPYVVHYLLFQFCYQKPVADVQKGDYALQMKVTTIVS